MTVRFRMNCVDFQPRSPGTTPSSTNRSRHPGVCQGPPRFRRTFEIQKFLHVTPPASSSSSAPGRHGHTPVRPILMTPAKPPGCDSRPSRATDGSPGFATRYPADSSETRLNCERLIRGSGGRTTGRSPSKTSSRNLLDGHRRLPPIDQPRARTDMSTRTTSEKTMSSTNGPGVLTL